MSFRSVLVTGANRGIGLEFIRQFLALDTPPKHVIASIFEKSDELKEWQKSNPNLHILKYDATDYASLPGFVERVQGIVKNDGLSLLINNAAIFIPGGIEELKPEDLVRNIEVNAVGPIMLTAKLLPLLRASAKQNMKTVVAQLSTPIGSINDNNSGGFYSYRTGKTALNMLFKTLSVDVKADNIIVLQLHPGWVESVMEKQMDVADKALIPAETSIKGMMKVINDSTIEKTALFANYLGQELRW